MLLLLILQFIVCLCHILQLFGEARALESQGNMAAAQRLYAKVTKISPRVRCVGFPLTTKTCTESYE